MKAVANDPQSTRSGLDVTIGTVQLNVIQSGVTLITGNVIELISKSGSSQIRLQDFAIGVGTGYASLTTSRRMLTPGLLSNTSQRTAHDLRERRRRATACDPCAEGSRVWGDVSGDCKLTSFDVYEASQLYLVRKASPPFGPGSYLCDWRQQQLDLSLDGQFKLVDVQYLLYVVAGKYRFVTNIQSQCSLLGPEPHAVQDMVFSVQIINDAGQPALSGTTNVRMEVSGPDFAYCEHRNQFGIFARWPLAYQGCW